MLAIVIAYSRFSGQKAAAVAFLFDWPLLPAQGERQPEKKPKKGFFFILQTVIQ